MEVTMEIYPMPAFPVLNVTDLAASARWYEEALGFGNVFTMPGPGGAPALVHLRWAKYADLLIVVRPQADGPRGLGVTLTFGCWGTGTTVDALAARAAAAGATIISPAAPTPWNTHECTIADPDGYRLTFTEPVNMEQTLDQTIANVVGTTSR